jgi:hypothetical protein
VFGRLLGKKNAAEPRGAAVEEAPPADDRPRVLNVGGASKQIPIPAYYAGWNHLLLDIDARGEPDVLCDARELDSLEPSQFDAVYCSHNLEHYYKHDGAQVLKGFLHVLKPEGFADIRVPDMTTVLRTFVANDMDIEDVLYQSPAGPITVRDVIYGWGVEIERSGEDFYAHKTGFTAASLRAAIEAAGFWGAFVLVDEKAYEIRALAFKTEPSAAQRALLHLPDGAFP